MSVFVQFLIGLLFGTGLVVAGMSDPAKVLNFLDVTRMWDPSLAFVMGGAVVVTFIGYRLAWQRQRPVYDAHFHIPLSKVLDAKLVLGSAIFGVGWGLGGLCPGPAFTALGTGKASAIIFVIAMCVGMVAARMVDVIKTKPLGGAT
jgi:uncharacterized protein